MVSQVSSFTNNTDCLLLKLMNFKHRRCTIMFTLTSVKNIKSGMYFKGATPDKNAVV